ncbi:hypothetical protein BCT21_07335 [Vibrio sp. 10N.222.55.F9]|uniref:hypothetical protein n=1 Tax=Vibrio sp. 10N.222.55.F9 TaxID=1884471 RepID=UPI000C822DF3|nr:hypothetical protein [Vibrio sp. 10N.222.55.F9]PMO02323.1 hypothetical protein BCT21_07335 [Vibrio sp. 10N.222.55.F9]
MGIVEDSSNEQLQAVQVKTLTWLVGVVGTGLALVIVFAFTDVYNTTNTNQTDIGSVQETLAGFKQKHDGLERRVSNLENENKELRTELTKVRDRVLVIETKNSKE